MMRTFDQWMADYGVSHQNPTNQKIHKVCVPLITLTIIGFLWAIPVPEIFKTVPFLNWATIFITACLCFYATLNKYMFAAMAIQGLIMCWISYELDKAGILLPFCVTVFFLSWAGQFYGHKIEGKKPSFFADIVFLLIGPLWVNRFLFRKFGIQV